MTDENQRNASLIFRLFQLISGAPHRFSRFQPYWIALVRVAMGVFFCISGGTKLFESAAHKSMVQTMIDSKIPFPEFQAVFVALVEFAFGGLLALGMVTSLGAFMLTCVMIVAILTNSLQSIQADSTLSWLDDFLYLPEVLYVFILGGFLFSGPGKPSVDSAIERWWRSGSKETLRDGN